MSAADVATASFTYQASTRRFSQILSDSLPGVRFLAHRLAMHLPSAVDVEDLVQVGILGLLQSVNRFDPARGVKFGTYANRRVQGAMLDYLRSMDWRPRSVRKRNRRLATASKAVEQRVGSSAEEEDLAAEVGVAISELQQWKQESSFTGNPMNGTWTDRGCEENSRDLLAELADPSDTPETLLQNDQTRRMVAEAIALLPGNERTVLSLYYYEQLPMKEIGQLLGVKQSRVSQLHTQAIQRLRSRLQDRPCSRRPQNLSHRSPDPRWLQ